MKKLLGLFSLLFIITFSVNVCFSGSFVNDAFGIKYDVGGGRYLQDGWAWCDPTGTGTGYCYYFNPAGYVLAGVATPDGEIVDAAGRWVKNGVVQTHNVEPLGYELSTASYNAEPSFPGINLNSSLSSRLNSMYNATPKSHTVGTQFYPEAIEFKEGGIPSISFNSGLNTSLSFELTGDSISDPADFVMDVYVNGVFSQRFSQRFIDLTTRVIQFPQYSNIDINIPVINDYYDSYVRYVYILNPYFG